jgi:hypothetical protein
MNPARADTATAITSVICIAAIVISALVAGMNHTLVKLGLVTIAGIAGFTLRGLVRW